MKPSPSRVSVQFDLILRRARVHVNLCHGEI